MIIDYQILDLFVRIVMHSSQLINQETVNLRVDKNRNCM